MKLYYTGANTFLATQENPLLSVGGYISSSPVASGGLSTLFGGISQQAMKNGAVETRGVALKNETGANQSVVVYYDNISKEPLSSFKMALVQPGKDDCDDFYLEKIASVYSKPINGIFVDNRGESNGVRFDLGPGVYMGIWIQRIVNQYQGTKSLSCDSMIEAFTSEDKQQVFDVVFGDSAVAGTYWTFGTANSRMYVWYDDGVENPVLLQDREGVRVAIQSGDDEVTIAHKTFQTLKSTVEARGEITVSENGSTITISQNQSGKMENPIPETSPITIVSTQGSSAEQETTENLEITIEY